MTNCILGCYQIFSEAQEKFEDVVMRQKQTLDPICKTITALCLIIISLSIACYALDVISPVAMHCTTGPFAILCILAIHVVNTIRRGEKTDLEAFKQRFEKQK